MSAQPSLDAATRVEGNPMSKEPQEQADSQKSAGQGQGQVQSRKPNDETTPTDTRSGVRGAGPGEKESDLSDQAKGRSHADDAEYAGAAGGEGDVASAVKGKSGR